MASGTQPTPAAKGGTPASGGTQEFPATGGTAVPQPGGSEPTEVLGQADRVPGQPGLNGLLSAFDRFDNTEVLPQARGRAEPVFDNTEVLPQTHGRTGPGIDETAVLPTAGGGRGGGAEVPRSPGRPEAFPAAAPASVRDPWQEPEPEPQPGDSGATHDPHEVTVQLDGIGLQLDGMIRAAKGGPAGGAESSDGPVFVDESGRRSRRFRRLGMAVGIACAVYAVVIVATLLSGNSNAPWLPVQSPKDEQPAGQVDTPALPEESVAPTATDESGLGSSPSVSDGVTPSPGSTAVAPDASATAEEPGATTAPEPTATKPTTDPGTEPTTDPEPTATKPTTPTADPDPTDEPTTPGPTETEGEDGPGGTGADNVAAGPPTPAPITTEGPAEEPGLIASPHDPSPEHTL